MAKNIYAVSMVKNESDIIESFCRHTLTFCDGMVICDDGSVDDTKVIIYALMDEGMNITLLDNTNTFGYYQQEITNSLINIAIDDFNADLVLPLDADEFLFSVATDSPPPRKVLEDLPEGIISTVRLVNFIPDEKVRDNTVFLPHYFSQYLLTKNIFTAVEAGKLVIGKVAVGPKIVKDLGGKVSQGNHFMHFPNDNTAYFGGAVKDLYLFHYPIRSVAQAMTKAVIGWANTLCVPNRVEDNIISPTHWQKMYNEIKESGTLHFNNLINMTKTYINPGDIDIENNDIPIREFFFTSDITLRYTDYNKAQQNYMNIILSHYEHIIATFMKNVQSGAK